MRFLSKSAIRFVHKNFRKKRLYKKRKEGLSIAYYNILLTLHMRSVKRKKKERTRAWDKTCHIISNVGKIKNKRGRREGGEVRKSKARQGGKLGATLEILKVNIVSTHSPKNKGIPSVSSPASSSLPRLPHSLPLAPPLIFSFC